MKILLPEIKRWVHDSRMDVRWGDMDMLGHVNNTVYFRYMETARVEWLRSTRGTPHEGKQGPVMRLGDMPPSPDMPPLPESKDTSWADMASAGLVAVSNAAPWEVLLALMMPTGTQTNLTFFSKG